MKKIAKPMTIASQPGITVVDEATAKVPTNIIAPPKREPVAIKAAAPIATAVKNIITP